MKKIFTLCVLTGIVIVTRSQAVLNEIYPQPGNGYHEFFELYNENNSLEYLDNYTLVTYYEEAGGKTGFYVLDLPNDSVAAHGYFVGASQITYNIQGQLGLTANISWNALGAGGTLTKWERSGSAYLSVAVPANLNDYFVKIVGAGGVFHVFLFKNGIIVNGLVAGLNSTVLPAYIKTMPNLFVDMSGSSPDFTINFSTLPDNSVEYLSNSAGTNNGYYRSADGLCGQWLKSDQPGQHNPGKTNGTAATSSSQLAIAAVITQYITDPTKSILSYNITAAPAGAFPAVVEVYRDLGIAGQWDVNDVLLDTRTINSASAGTQYVILPSWDIAVIIVVKSATACYNRIMPLESYSSVLPVNLISFRGSLSKTNRVTLDWTISNNERINGFEIERSSDGKEFAPAALVFASEKNGTEKYMFFETINSQEKIMYRLKMIDKENNISYSKTLVFQDRNTGNSEIKILGNPVNDKLTFSYNTTDAGIANINVYEFSGRLLISKKINSDEGNNILSIQLNNSFKTGMYLLEVKSGTEIYSAKFLKQ